MGETERTLGRDSVRIRPRCREESKGMTRFRILSIGVSDYIDQNILGIAPCDADAESVFATFCDKDFGTCTADESSLLTSKGDAADQSSRASILLQLARLTELAKADEGLIVYFSGHGTENNSNSYLVCHDTQSAIIDSTGILLSEVFAKLRQSAAKYKVLILDCCKPGFLIGKDSAQGMTESFQKVIDDAMHELRDECLVILASCKANQVSYILDDRSQSVFTHYLLAGLNGGAVSVQGDGYVSLSELYDFVLDKVRQWSLSNNKQQVPYLATEITGALNTIKLVKSRPPVKPETPVAVRAEKPFTVAKIQLDGSRSFPYPTKVVRRDGFPMLLSVATYGSVVEEVDENAKPSVDQNAQNYITSLLARLSASLLQFYKAQDISQSNAGRITFPSGEVYGDDDRQHKAAVASYRLRLRAEEQSFAIAEQMRGLFAWDRLHLDVDLTAEPNLADMVEHFKTRSWRVAEFIPDDYVTVEVDSFGANSRPARITVAKRENPKRLRVTFALDTVSKEHDIRALAESISVILGI